MESVIANGTLIGELETKTNIFVDNVIPATVMHVVQLPVCSLEEQQCAVRILQKTIELVGCSFARNKRDIIKAVCPMLVDSASFFRWNGVPPGAQDGRLSTCYDAVMRHFAQCGAMKFMATGCLVDDAPILAFDIFFMFAEQLSKVFPSDIGEWGAEIDRVISVLLKN